MIDVYRSLNYLVILGGNYKILAGKAGVDIIKVPITLLAYQGKLP